ncbi:MAG TPA: A/G-specific adenine glycosylase, partial [Gammaproteobacteria bacterium]|nr:A/G-specific adenine glycosylase [Gammaproteobacteria bacterium]
MVDRFAERLLGWYDRHGRKGLPWQENRTAYTVWLAEIMLQQTQVATVIPYYQRFLEYFPHITVLAEADIDEVLHLWSGLGYYARGRNLHRAAQVIRDEHGGVFPQSFEEVVALPGIGRSTAGAILSQAFGQRHPILDGNVKRLLSRIHAVEGWPGKAPVERLLWQLASRYLPHERMADYTQAIMDFGATLCSRTRPACAHCPFADDCHAHQHGREQELPAPRKSSRLPLRRTTLLLITDTEGRVLLERRPPAGIWGGLWSFPECGDEMDPAGWCCEELGCEVELQEPLPPLHHAFSHFRLVITPLPARLLDNCIGVMEARPLLW